MSVFTNFLFCITFVFSFTFLLNVLCFMLDRNVKIKTVYSVEATNSFVATPSLTYQTYFWFNFVGVL